MADEDVKPLDTGDAGQVKIRKTKVQLQKERENQELKKVLALPEGRAVLWRILAKCNIYGIVIDDIQEGKRRIGLEILGDLLTCKPNVYILMQNEHIHPLTHRGN